MAVVENLTSISQTITGLVSIEARQGYRRDFFCVITLLGNLRVLAVGPQP